jgi:hypothetical protein
MMGCLQCGGMHHVGWCPADRPAVNRVKGKPHLLRHRRQWEVWAERSTPRELTDAANKVALRVNAQQFVQVARDLGLPV